VNLRHFHQGFVRARDLSLNNIGLVMLAGDKKIAAMETGQPLSGLSSHLILVINPGSGV
jgi:hypothetical protein